MEHPHREGQKGAMACALPPPPRPEGEERRLQALSRYCVPDAAPEPAFGRIANLARALFDTPAAMVSVVDETRQWFMARQGFDMAETPRVWAFCAYTILGDAPMVVQDAVLEGAEEVAI